ncbi:MAG: PHP domain-containing protein [Gemmatimonadetes bacterium]|nr:MAG: PHP domain-containing protein [Gemmatimonadota bacterium]
MRLDLHVHSTASDGACSPAEVVRLALAGRLDVIALTDHDTLAGLAEARREARGHAIEVVAAVELSSHWDEQDVHILGYFVDPAAPALRDHVARAATRRTERMREMVDRLRDQDLEVRFEDVLDIAGEGDTTLGRPHLARALVQGGHVGSVGEAFDRYLGDGLPAHVPVRLGGPAEAVETVLAAGGVAVWAHPPLRLLDPLLPSLVSAGLRGLELHRPRTRPEVFERIEAAARRHGLLVSGGSDWHGPDQGELGDFYVTERDVEALLEAGGL